MPNHYVYRHYDRFDNLLYIGETCNPDGRRYGHVSNSYWMTMASKEEILEFNNKDEAIFYEKETIISEQPLYNKMYNDANYFTYFCPVTKDVLKKVGYQAKELNKLTRPKRDKRLCVADMLVLSACYSYQNNNDFLTWALNG